MGYTSNGTPIMPQVDIELQPQLPAHASIINKLKQGFIKIDDKLRFNLLSGLAKSDGTIDRTSIDNLVTLLAAGPEGLGVQGIVGNNLTNMPQYLKCALDNTSADTKTWTPGTGKKWLVEFLITHNGNRAAFQWLQVVNGGVTVQRGIYTVATPIANYTDVLSTVASGPPANPLIIDENTDIATYDSSFVAGDAKKSQVVYYEI